MNDLYLLAEYAKRQPVNDVRGLLRDAVLRLDAWIEELRAIPVKGRSQARRMSHLRRTAEKLRTECMLWLREVPHAHYDGDRITAYDLEFLPLRPIRIIVPEQPKHGKTDEVQVLNVARGDN